MAKTRKSLVVLLLLPFLLGMGSLLGEDSADEIPMPEKKFTAIYVDQMDVTTECTNVSIQGKAFIEGKKGEGTYAVPFDKIRSIVFILKGKTLKGIVTLYDREKIELVLHRDHKAYGTARYGTYQIRLLDLKKMVFIIEE